MKIFAVINATYAVAKRKPEKISLAGIRTLTSAIPVQRSNQLSYQANWELAIKLVRNIPGKDEDEILHSAVQIYECHIFIMSSSSFPGILRTNLMTNSQLA